MRFRTGPLAAMMLSALTLFILPIALQVQTNLHKTDGSVLLRASVADIVLPLAGLGVLISLLTRQSVWPRWRLGRMGLWLWALMGVLVLAAGHTYLSWHQINLWAWGNKVAGFAILSAFFYLGGWAGTNLPRESFERFVRIFVGFSLVCLIVQSILMGIGHIYSLGFRDILEFPISGLMANRNAYGFLILTTFILGLGLYMNVSLTCRGDRALCFLFFLMPFAWVYNGSRAGMIAFLLVLILAGILYRRRMIRVTKYILAGLLTLCALYAAQPYKLKITHYQQTEILQHVPDLSSAETVVQHAQTMESPGDSNRLKIIVAALEQIREKPIFGSGLGSAKLHQTQKYGAPIDIIDNTALWLLTETGIAGFGIFALFFISVIRIFVINRHRNEWDHIGLLMLVGFAVMSLFHELMYTRFLWVLMGFWLAVPKTRLPE